VDRSRVIAIIPAFNEGKTIGALVAAARQHLPVLVVDDHSDDDTGAKAEAAGAIVVRNELNLGYEGALNRGCEVALEHGFDGVITLDGDGEHDPALLEAFIQALVDQNIPLVLGIRPKTQRVTESFAAIYVQSRYGVRDILCGMKGYQSWLIVENGGFDSTKSVGTELALNSIRHGAKFVQLPVVGNRRNDLPRFGNAFRANKRIVALLARIIAQDVVAAWRRGITRATKADPPRTAS